MALLGSIFFAFLGVCAVVACLRCAKMAIRMINGMFDKLEGKFK